MYRSLITVRYAKALFLKATEEEVLDDVIRDLRFIQQAFNENSDLVDAISHPVTLTSKKKNIIRALFEDKIQPVSLNFLLLILKNHREYYFNDIFRNVIDLYNESRGIKSVELTTAVKIGEQERKDIEQFVRKTFKAKEISFVEKVNPELIGGFIIQIEDQLLDSSVRRQLIKIRHDLMNNKMNL